MREPLELEIGIDSEVEGRPIEPQMRFRPTWFIQRRATEEHAT
jgi:hypothetical protein